VIALEALSETTNGDADSVVMNPSCQLPKFFEAQPTADAANEKSGLPRPSAQRGLVAMSDVKTFSFSYAAAPARARAWTNETAVNRLDVARRKAWTGPLPQAFAIAIHQQNRSNGAGNQFSTSVSGRECPVAMISTSRFRPQAAFPPFLNHMSVFVPYHPSTFPDCSIV